MSLEERRKQAGIELDNVLAALATERRGGYPSNFVEQAARDACAWVSFESKQASLYFNAASSRAKKEENKRKCSLASNFYARRAVKLAEPDHHILGKRPSPEQLTAAFADIGGTEAEVKAAMFWASRHDKKVTAFIHASRPKFEAEDPARTDRIAERLPRLALYLMDGL